MEMEEFESIIEEAAGAIPVEFKKILEKEGIELVARERTPRVLQEQFGDSTVFGVFIGVAMDKRSVFNIQQEPTRIELYKESFESVFSNPRQVRDQIARTVVHEIGHYFGFDERQLRGMGY